MVCLFKLLLLLLLLFDERDVCLFVGCFLALLLVMWWWLFKLSSFVFGLSCLIFLLAILWIFECVPLCNWTTWRCQHIGPMTQLSAGCWISKNDLANWLRCTDTIVIDNGHHKLHLLRIGMHAFCIYCNVCTTSFIPQSEFIWIVEWGGTRCKSKEEEKKREKANEIYSWKWNACQFFFWYPVICYSDWINCYV